MLEIHTKRYKIKQTSGLACTSNASPDTIKTHWQAQCPLLYLFETGYTSHIYQVLRR